MHIARPGISVHCRQRILLDGPHRNSGWQPLVDDPIKCSTSSGRLDADRCEDMFLSLTPAIQKGDPQAVRTAFRCSR